MSSTLDLNVCLFFYTAACVLLLTRCIQIIGIDTVALFALCLYTCINLRYFCDNNYTLLFMKDNIISA